MRHRVLRTTRVLLAHRWYEVCDLRRPKCIYDILLLFGHDERGVFGCVLKMGSRRFFGGGRKLDTVTVTYEVCGTI